MSYDFKTSRPAYEDAKMNINDKQAMVIKAIRDLKICTDAHISEYLDWPINRVTPRRGELVDRGLVVCDGKRRDKVTKRAVNFLKIKQQGSQIELF